MQVHIRTKNSSTNLSTVSHKGKTYLVAPAEGEYEIVLTNNSNRRRMAVIAVDGMSVMDGKLAKKDDHNGYVLNAWQTAIIKGWRRTDEEVAAFEFTPNEGSYSEAVGNGTRNTGVISVAVFDEKPPVSIGIPRPPWSSPLPWRDDRIYPYWSTNTLGGVVRQSQTVDDAMMETAQFSATTNSASASTLGGSSVKGAVKRRQMKSTSANPADVDLGTGYGSKTEMHTREVSFTCSTEAPVEVILFYYGTEERLKARGVPVKKAISPVADPNPFPGGVSCPAPDGWEG